MLAMGTELLKTFLQSHQEDLALDRARLARGRQLACSQPRVALLGAGPEAWLGPARAGPGIFLRVLSGGTQTKQNGERMLRNGAID